MTPSPFPPTSRYATVEVTTHTESGGRVIAHFRRRLCPDPEQLTPVSTYTVVQDDRLDRIAARTIGDPLQFWQVADANRAMRPDELAEPIGRRLTIALPAGFGGLPGA